MIQRYAQFSFFRKGSETSFSTAFCLWFFKENVSHVTFYWPTKFHCLIAFLLQKLGNICIKIVCYSGCDVIKFEINLIVLIKPFRYITKKSRQNLIYLEKERSFWDKIKIFFIIFNGLSVAKNRLKPESVPLKRYNLLC